jgi:dihydroneopterin aldolase
VGIIRIEDIRCFSYHGCMDEEGVIGAVFSVDIELKTDLSVSAKSDLLADTIDYVAVSKLVQEEMAIKSKLIEHATQRILNRLMKAFPSIESCKVLVVKHAAPIDGEVKRVCVTLEAKR